MPVWMPNRAAGLCGSTSLDEDPVLPIEGELDTVVVLADRHSRQPKSECHERDDERQAVARADDVHAGTVAEAHVQAGSGESRNDRPGHGGTQATPAVDSDAVAPLARRRIAIASAPTRNTTPPTMNGPDEPETDATPAPTIGPMMPAAYNGR